MKPRDLFVAGAVVLVMSGLFTLPALDRLDGLSIDILFWLRHQTFGARHAPAASPAVVVAIDEETYRREPFRNLPKVMWTRHLAAVIDAVLAGGARVIGFDVIYPTSVEQFVKGADRDLLITLRRASKNNQVVLGKVQHQYKPIIPFPGYSFAVGHGSNVRSVNLFADVDGVIRHVPLIFGAGKGDEETSLALELAARTQGVTPRRTDSGEIAFGDAAIPGSRTNRMAINFDGGPEPVPTFSLADLYACAESGDAGYFRHHFDGKVVLVGVTLDVEDRKLTSRRFITEPEGEGLPERCVYPVMSEMYIKDLRRESIPAVYVQAQAINDLLRGEPLREPGRLAIGLIVLVLTAIVAMAAMTVSFLRAGIVLALVSVLWTGTATLLFVDALVVPLIRPIAAAALSFSVLLGYRFTIADRDKRQLRQAFSLYLPSVVVDRMIAEGRVPRLGGESREVTVWFSDIASFTALSENMTPKELVRLLNAYLSEVTTIIENHSGFVDKYIGDAVVAVFGAPLDDPDHALHSIEAALACQRRLELLNEETDLSMAGPLVTRIGINTGEVLVGNIGSHRRFNYTVMGDVVNLASRLEGANKTYGTQILASDTTAERCGDRLLCREIDLVRVAGRATPVRIFEPLAIAGTDHPAPDGAHWQRDPALASFAAALGDFRARRFAAAAEVFAMLAESDPVAARFAERATACAASPPPEDWDGVADLPKLQ